MNFVHVLGWTLLHFCWQGAAVAGLLWCVLALLEQRASVMRYGSACGALALMVAAPVVTFWELAAEASRAGVKGSVPVVEWVITVVPGAGGGHWVERMAGVLDGATPFVPWLWMAGVTVFLLRLNLGLVAARRMTTVGTGPVEGALAGQFEDLKVRLGVRRVVRLLQTARVESPTVIGWLRPVVLMPVGCLARLSTAQVEALLVHELAHIRRNDYLVNVLQSVVEALLFYHPAVWWVSKQVRLERECRCDALAVEAGGDALGYAKALSFLATRRAFLQDVALGANGGVLTMRIKRLLGYRESSVGAQGAALALLVAVMVVPGGYFARTARAERATVRVASTPVETLDRVAEGEVESGDGQKPTLTVARMEVPPVGGQEPKRLSVGAGVMAGQLITKVDPVYPAEAKANGVQGAVVLKAEISTEGKIENLQVESGPRELMSSALDAVRQWVYKPYLLNGDPVAVSTSITVNYRLGDATEGEGSVWMKGTRSVPSGLMAGQLVSRVDPVYPVEAKEKRVQGAVVLRVVITKEGKVRDLELMSPPSLLTQSALDAVRQWVYKPYLLNGEPQEVQTTITVNFTLDGGSQGAGGEAGASSPGASSSAGVLPSGPQRVRAGIMAGQLKSHGPMVYPAEAKAKGIEGMVVLRAVISKEGTISNLQVLSGPEELRAGAIDAVKQWTYNPYLLNGEPTEVDTTISVNFRMGGGSASAAEPKRIGNGVLAPVPVHMEDPSYTEEARKDKVSGDVLVNLTVDENGNPTHVRVVRGIGHGLDEKAVEAVRQYKFKPAMENGKPVPVQITIQVNFKIF